ncbi:MAG: AAA family ATPase, partial [Clostridia bacterium]|nr:AAA family ATPase [Clostridia bacterium]
MIIAIANQKGGVAKTATAQAIATGAAKIGRRSLAIDADPQANLSFSMGGNSADKGLYELMTGAATPGQIIQ